MRCHRGRSCHKSTMRRACSGAFIGLRFVMSFEATHPNQTAPGLLRVAQPERRVDARRLAMVHVRSHERHRHSVNTLMTFASVPTIRPWQNGHAVGRVMAGSFRDSNIVIPFTVLEGTPSKMYLIAQRKRRPEAVSHDALKAEGRSACRVADV